jgi:hypothetical protein
MNLKKAALAVIRAWDGNQFESTTADAILAMANLREAIALIKDQNELGSGNVRTTGDGPREGLGICVR